MKYLEQQDGNWIIPGGKKGDGSREVKERSPPKRSRSKEYLRGVKVKQYSKDFNMPDSYDGNSKRKNVCLKWFFNGVLLSQKVQVDQRKVGDSNLR